ncbi:glycosyltransferase [Aminobacter anthyllidis]|uniref:glycosyltransferase family 2 protein n=1 Tax=Aminobacter anthyllidis TaxID=1035067 RepID=UPI0024577EC3|nr:glycosyltransferase family 2 protein [Aminobacter anthyllidis]MDH4987035.1 glycosyltransferase [Aminobacter anthyllidis]
MTELGMTIAICTRNRAPVLARCLAALVAAETPRSSFEILVVANDCGDDSLQVALRFADRLPMVVVEEPQGGLSHARNRAIAEARGRLIVWLDDDALVRPGFLRAYEAAIAASPRCSIFGGVIVPCLDGQPPAWLVAGLDVVESAYAARRRATADVFADGNADLPFGANYAMVADVQRRFHFDPELGRRPGKPFAGGEEIAVMRAALAAGHHGRWIPDAIVDHLIGQERQSEAWLWGYFRADAQQRISGRPPSLWGRLKACRAFRRYRRARTVEQPREWLALLVKAAQLAGKAGVRPAL